MTIDLVGRAIMTFDIVALAWAAWWSWRQGRGNDATLTSGAASIASVGFATAAAIVLYGLMR